MAEVVRFARLNAERAAVVRVSSERRIGIVTRADGVREFWPYAQEGFTAAELRAIAAFLEQREEREERDG